MHIQMYHPATEMFYMVWEKRKKSGRQCSVYSDSWTITKIIAIYMCSATGLYYFRNQQPKAMETLQLLGNAINSWLIFNPFPL